jgi:organic hydroperoxide reductase OsmC/OhrA
MAGREHRYAVTIRWTGDTGTGTSGYRSYERAHEISAEGGKPPIPGSSDPAFRGDPDRWNPEELLVASLSACHQLWYLHLCAEAGVVVTGYADEAEGVMEETPDGGGRFVRATLRPRVRIARGCDPDLAIRLHRAAHEKCFIANSVAFPVDLDPAVSLAQ